MDKCKTRSFEKYKKGLKTLYCINQDFPYARNLRKTAKGGVTPLEEKSLGRIEKTGFAEIIVVFACGKRVKE